MPFPRKLLHSTEELVLDLRPHWLAIAPASAALFGTCVLGILLAVADVPAPLLILALVLIAVALGYFVVKLLGWTNTMFVLTTDRIITRRGVLSKSGIEIPLERINTVFFNQRLIERMLGAGDLGIESAGERGNETFENIRKPAIVQREIYVQMEDNENRKFDRVRAPAAEAPSAADEVARFYALFQQGAISAQEYEAQKARILGG